MHTLPNNCRAGKITVFPKNWKSVNANKNLTWKIWYRFYDDNLNEVKLIIIKGMNSAEDLKEKREIVEIILADELAALKNGYNPITKISTADSNKTLGRNTPFIKALYLAHESLNCIDRFKKDIKSSLAYIENAAKELKIDLLPVFDIHRGHIINVLDTCAKQKDYWSNNTFNSYKRNLSMLFGKLLDSMVINTNPTREIKKKKTIRKLKRLLTPDECRRIDDFTKKYDRRFWLLINIFFHSGSRTTEMFRVKFEHVNLETQFVTYTVLKGNQPFEVERPIKNIALDFWREAIRDAGPGDYIFSKGLKPGPLPISERQATIRWRRHIKGTKEAGKLGITCSWYQLKYLNTDQISRAKGLKIAGLLNSHTNENTTRLYAVNEDERDFEELKKMPNAFVQGS